jgi:RNA polymerase sigma-70 factor (sigma-E family)
LTVEDPQPLKVDRRLRNPWLGGDVNSARHEEFRDYVADRGPALMRIAVRLTGDRAEAEDLLQSALAKTYLAWDRIQDRAAVDGYVRRAMVNTRISWWRHRKLEVYPTDELPEQPVDDHTGTTELHDALGRALDKLPERQRLAVKLRYYEDMPETEIAKVLGVSIGTVKSTVSRAMAKLRDDALLEADFPRIPFRRP